MNNLSITEGGSGGSTTSTSAVKTHKKANSILHLNEVVGLIFLDVVCAIDLPPAKAGTHLLSHPIFYVIHFFPLILYNDHKIVIISVVTKVGFDMDPFVVVSFSKNTFRSQVINHSLNPEWNEKIHFPVLRSEGNYKIKFSVYDWDKFSDNDLVASQYFPVKPLIDAAEQKYEHKYKALDVNDELVEHVLHLEVHSKRKEVQSKLVIKVKFVPYEQLRTQFWMALAKTYDSDENSVLNLVEIETMLNSLGSSLTSETIETFFTRFGKIPQRHALTFDEIVKCMEDRLGEAKISHQSADQDGEEADNEHLIYLRECPICHRPDLYQLNETDVVTHVAICASSDWGKIDNFLTGDFVTESQAQRKWVTKIIAKVGFGNYKIGGVSIKEIDTDINLKAMAIF